MAVLFVDGFTGVPRAQSIAANSQLPALGWALRVRYNGTAAAESNTAYQVAIEADPVFPARNQVAFVCGNYNYTNLLQMTQYRDTTGYQKFVIGFTASVTSTNTTIATGMHIYLSGTTLWNSATSGFPTADIFADLMVPFNGADGTATAPMTGQTQTSPALKRDKEFHVEAFIEQDVDRCRIYVDGVLTLDFTYTGTFASATGGFSLLMGKNPGGTTSSDTARVANVYLLGCDDIHTGPLGPATRVFEVAPAADVAVQFSRDDTFSSNAAVLQQMFGQADPGYIFTGDPATDLYSIPTNLGLNAAQIYGVAMKVNAMTMASGTHRLAGTARYNGVDAVGPTTFTLTLGTLAPGVVDISRNPSTQIRWKTSEILNGAIGIRLVD